MSKYEFDQYDDYDLENDVNDPEYTKRRTGYYENNEFEEDDRFNKLTPEEQEKVIKDFAMFAERVRNGDYGLEGDISEIAQDLYDKGFTSGDTEVIRDYAEDITNYFKAKFDDETAEKATKKAIEGIKKELDSMKKMKGR